MYGQQVHPSGLITITSKPPDPAVTITVAKLKAMQAVIDAQAIEIKRSREWIGEQMVHTGMCMSDPWGMEYEDGRKCGERGCWISKAQRHTDKATEALKGTP